MSALDIYFDTVMQRVASLRAKSSEGIQKVADACVRSLLAGGAVHVYDTGHLVSRELINRAGGLAAFVPLAFTLTVDNPHPARGSEADLRGDKPATGDLVRAALGQSNLRAGDVLILGSVSGVSPVVVELALQAGAMQVVTVALTSFEYSDRLEPRHPSGKRLREVTALALDNGAPFGDAMLSMEGLRHPCCPFSGLGAVLCMWALVAEVCERMVQQGSDPTVYPSINLPNGPALYAEERKRVTERGF
ncbi:MAG: hypothetical protein AMXMBFR61_17990 [Fimbriimonadales bacterium]